MWPIDIKGGIFTNPLRPRGNYSLITVILYHAAEILFPQSTYKAVGRVDEHFPQRIFAGYFAKCIVYGHAICSITDRQAESVVQISTDAGTMS